MKVVRVVILIRGYLNYMRSRTYLEESRDKSRPNLEGPILLLGTCQKLQELLNAKLENSF